MSGVAGIFDVNVGKITLLATGFLLRKDLLATEQHLPASSRRDDSGRSSRGYPHEERRPKITGEYRVYRENGNPRERVNIGSGKLLPSITDLWRATMKKQNNVKGAAPLKELIEWG